MHQATRFQFERTAQEFAAWRAVKEDVRSPAAAWWWGPAMAVRDAQEPMPQPLCDALEMPPGSSFAAAAEKLIAAIAEQTSLPWPSQFPRVSRYNTEEPQDTVATS